MQHKKNIKTNNVLQEYSPSGRWIERKHERVQNVNQILLPLSFYHEEDDKIAINAMLLTLTKLELNIRTNVFEMGEKSNKGHVDIHKIAAVKIKRDNKLYAPVFKARSVSKTGKIREDLGNVWVAVIINETLVTLMLFKNDTSDSAIVAQVQSLENRKSQEIQKPVNPSIIEYQPLSIYIDYDREIQKEPELLTPKKKIILNYTPKADYRPGTRFAHKEFGTGKILNSSEDPIADQVYKTVTIEFPKIGIKTLTNIYTNKNKKIQHLLRNEQTQYYKAVLEQLTKKKIILL